MNLRDNKDAEEEQVEIVILDTLYQKLSRKSVGDNNNKKLAVVQTRMIINQKPVVALVLDKILLNHEQHLRSLW